MDNLSPVPRPEGGYPLLAPMEYQDIAPKPKFRLRKFLSFLRRLWWVPVVTLVLCLGAAAAHFFFAPPEFVSTSSMWETEKLRLPEGASFSEDPETYFGTLSAVLKSATLRQLTLDRMRAAGTNGIVLDKDGNPLPVDIEVFAAQQAAVFRLQATSANPAFTSLYLNALMNAYLDYKKVVRKQVSGDTLASISAQIFQLETGMKSEQERLAQYEQSNNIIVLQQENQVAAAFLGKLKTQLADYQLQSKLLDAVALEKNSPLVLGTTNLTSPLFASLSGGNSSSSPVAASQSAYAQIESLKFQRRQLSKYLRPEHPKIVKLDQQIADAQNLIDTYTKQNEQDIVSARQALKIRIDSTRQSIDEWEKKVADASACMAQAESLKANLARNQSLYDRLVSLLQNVDITRNIDQETLAVLQPATGAVRSYRLLRSDLSTATVGGLALGFGIVLLVAVRDDRFSSVVEVTEKVGDNIVGQVPEIPELHSKTPLPLRGNDEQQHMYVEPYRNLRSALLFFAVNGERPRLLLVTSAIPNEGKSTIATNLSCTMALGGSRVLLIDADLRKGRLHDMLGLSAKPGLAELLQQSADPERFIQSTPLANLSFLPRGATLRNPGDLFLSPAFDQLLTRLREKFDHVIIDSSPVFAADDSTTLAPKMDGTLFVVRSRFSRAAIVREALELLYQRQAKVLGLVLNRADAKAHSYNYYKYSEYFSAETK